MVVGVLRREDLACLVNKRKRNVEPFALVEFPKVGSRDWATVFARTAVDRVPAVGKD
jgi:hypothetical protein